MRAVNSSFAGGDAVFTTRSEKYLGVIAGTRTLKDIVCKKLKDEYDSTLAYLVVIDFEVRPEGFELGQISPDDGPSRPAMVATGDAEIVVSTYSRVNPRKQEILEKAMRLGCEWAIKESGCETPSMIKLPLETVNREILKISNKTRLS